MAHTMYHRPPRRKLLIKLIATYTGLILLVLAIVTFISLFVLGFRFDVDKGHIEQYAFLQFDSSPSGASVTVDGASVGMATPNKTSLPAGKHEVAMKRNGYETWTKSVDAKAGVITWLNYTLLVPSKLVVEPIANYESVYLSLASPKGRSILVQRLAETPTFSLVDLSSDTPKSTELTIPANSYSQASTAGVTHTFQIDRWDDGGRYVLIKHTYGSNNEWLVLDTQNVALTKNITGLSGLLNISKITFSGTSGNLFYALDSGDIRKLDLSTGINSRPLVSNVTSFEIYESNIIAYVGVTTTSADKRVVGLYRDGDDRSYILRTVTSSKDVPLNIATTHYFNEDYVVIAEGKKVDILGGSYPNTASDDVTSLKIIASFETKEDVRELMFSPIGQYVFIQSGAYFASYDLEYQTFSSSNIEGTGVVSPIKWLDENYVWSNRDGKLTIREFDGTNAHTINLVLAGQDVALTHNGRYLYSINQVGIGFQLQRVRMILP